MTRDDDGAEELSDEERAQLAADLSLAIAEMERRLFVRRVWLFCILGCAATWALIWWLL